MKYLKWLGIVSTVLVIVLTLFFFRYNLFNSENVKVNYSLRSLEIYNSIFFPSFSTGKVEEKDSVGSVTGYLEYLEGKIVFRESRYSNGNLNLEIPIKYCSSHGTVRHYHENGNLKYEVEYHLGFKHGFAREFDENGVLIKQVEYYHDSKVEPS